MISTVRFDDQPGDYYGTIYKGPLLTPILGIVLVVGIWWLLRKRK